MKIYIKHCKLKTDCLYLKKKTTKTFIFEVVVFRGN